MIGVSLKMAKSKGEHIGGEPYENLAKAIIVWAARDWRTAYRATKHAKGTYSREAWNRVYNCESFFRSAWFQTLVNGNIDGNLLIKRLRKEEDERWNKLHKQT